ncbi:hypothetical protein CKO25_19800 [Thiocapsa imhoffii]|uniref:Sulfotransferase family protein n=1 Tax=Thiocapsa imhoffii TaxID=382777 RepID=A0A9X1BBR7_9GAMM|nr:sulfotransferase family 2 domain-containing protein [Thiocapsa imhoffii]MBK1646836.1 hypothetical protein [Thiocapsa imhoffii]
MMYCDHWNLLFIVLPKCGTGAGKRFFNDLPGTNCYAPKGSDKYSDHRFCAAGKEYNTKHFKGRSIGHATAKELCEFFGREVFSTMNTVAIIRNPYSRLVSSYFFYRRIHLRKYTSEAVKRISKLPLTARPSVVVQNFLTIIACGFTKVVPLWLYVIFYPYKGMKSYISDVNGTRIVKHIARLESVDDDLTRIMQRMGVTINRTAKLPIVNPTGYDKNKSYTPESWIVKQIVSLKLRDDLQLWYEVNAEFEEETIP